MNAIKYKNILTNKKTAFFSLLILNFVLFFVAFSSNLSRLDQIWQTDEYSHGYLIPLVALLIGWHRLAEKRPLVETSFGGSFFIALGGLFLVASNLATFQQPAFYGFVLGLYGITLSFLGNHVSKTLLPSFIYLLFAIPLPTFFYVTLSQQLQLWSSTLGVLPLKLLGLSVFQDGNIIDLGTTKLQVVEACNGLRYLFPLMSFGFLIAYLYEGAFWKRVVLFLSAIPLTLVMNALRIAVIGLTVDRWGPQMAEGVLHDFEGWTIFIGCVGLLFGEMWVLDRIGTRGCFRHEILGLAHGPYFAQKSEIKIKKPAFLSTLIVLVLALLFSTGAINERKEVVPQHLSFALFPLRLGAWVGRPEPLSTEVLERLALTDYFQATYERSDEERPVSFYMTFYASQRIGTLTHSPSNCIPGGGWRIEKRFPQEITFPNGRKITVSRMDIVKDEMRQIVLFWFQERGRVLSNQFDLKWHMLTDSLTMNRTDGGMVRVVTGVKMNETPDDAEKRLESFLAEAFPLIESFIPGKDPFPSIAPR